MRLNHAWVGLRHVGDTGSAVVDRGYAQLRFQRDRLADVMEQLPNSAAMRQTLGEINATLRETSAVLGAMRGVIGEGKETLRATETVLAFFQARGVGAGASDGSFDVSQYTAALQELGVAARELNALVGNTTRLVESPVLNERVEGTQSVAETGFGRVADLSNGFADRVFWRALMLIAAFFAALFVYRVAAMWIVKRLSQGSRGGSQIV